MRRPAIGACLLALLATTAGGEEQAPDRQAATRATLTLADAAGEPVAAPRAGAPFALTVALTDAATGAAPKGLVLEGWIRPVAQTDLPCAEAARAFRATRRIPAGGIDLNGVLLASFNEDGSYGIADPRLDLATANMVAAGSLGPAPPDFVAVDREGQRVLAWSRAGARLRAVAAVGETSEFALPLPAPRLAGLAAGRDGAVWLGGAGTDGRSVALVGRDGALLAREVLAHPVAGLLPLGDDAVLAWTGGGTVAGFDRGTGARRFGGDVGMSLRDAAAAALPDSAGGRTVALALLGPGRDDGFLAFADAPGAALPVELAAPADRVAMDPLTGTALFWNEAGAVSVVDPGTATLSGAVALAAGLGAVAFAGDAAFLLKPDGSGLSVLDLPSVVPGAAPNLRQVSLGPRAAEPAVGSVSGLLVPLDPAPQVLAVNAETYTAFVVGEHNAMGDAPPMTAVRLRGGRPARVVAIDRAFREDAPGRFTTRASVPEPGPHELVLTTGIGGMSTCFRFDVAGETAPETAAAPAPTLEVAPEASPRAGEATRLSLMLRDATGAPIRPAAPRLVAASLEFGWRGERVPEAVGGALTVALTFPVAGLYLLELSDAAGVSARTILEVRP